MTTAYATAEDMTARFGESEMALLADISDDAVEMALQDASDEAESYVAVNYTPPLPNIPSPLTTAVCDIARFKLYKERATEEVKYRYEAAVKWLVRLSKGEVRLTFDPALTPDEVEVVITPASPVVGSANGGIFSDVVFAAMPVSDIEMAPFPMQRITW